MPEESHMSLTLLAMMDGGCDKGPATFHFQAFFCQSKLAACTEDSPV